MAQSKGAAMRCVRTVCLAIGGRLRDIGVVIGMVVVGRETVYAAKKQLRLPDAETRGSLGGIPLHRLIDIAFSFAYNLYCIPEKNKSGTKLLTFC